MIESEFKARPIAALLALLFTSALATLPARATTPVPVAISHFAFAPKELTVPVGTTVVWTNRDETPHMVVDRGKSFASKGMDTDDSFSFTFAHPGDFSYFCTMHPFMTGTVHVVGK